MNAGVPTAKPAIVSVDPLCEDGRSVTSSRTLCCSSRPTNLARPQSTTRVSPYLPTTTFDGFRSRWITPRLCGVLDRVADVDETPEELLEPQPRLARTQAAPAPALVELPDRVLEALALDEAHHVERLAPLVAADRVDRDDPGVLQPRRHLGLELEPHPAVLFPRGARPAAP